MKWFVSFFRGTVASIFLEAFDDVGRAAADELKIEISGREGLTPEQRTAAKQLIDSIEWRIRNAVLARLQGT